MKVKIGNYREPWTSRYLQHKWNIKRYNKYIARDPDALDKVVSGALTLWDNTVNRLINSFWGNKSRTVNIKVDPWDIYNANTTIAMVSLPLLIEFRKNLHGGPATDDEDVPEYLRSTNAPPVDSQWDADANWHLRWEWIVDEIIWTFRQLVDENSESQFFHYFDKDFKAPPGWVWIPGLFSHEGFWVDRVGEDKHQARIDNGLRLFGKYYKALWD